MARRAPRSDSTSSAATAAGSDVGSGGRAGAFNWLGKVIGGIGIKVKIFNN